MVLQFDMSALESGRASVSHEPLTLKVQMPIYMVGIGCVAVTVWGPVVEGIECHPAVLSV